jgi:hypothetical protein
MTTISDNSGFIDYAAFGVCPEDLSSLRALSAVWRSAVLKVAGRFGTNASFDEFVEQTLELPLRIADIGWQRQWMQSWHKLSSSGFTMADMFAFFNHAMVCAEADLFGDLSKVGRIQLDLFGILRRSVVAAISCAIELGEEVHNSELGLPGETAAMRALRQISENGQGAVLSVSMVNIGPCPT